MSATSRARGPTDLAPYLMVAGLLSVSVLVVGAWAAMLAGAVIAHRPRPARNPFAAVIALAAGKSAWPGTPATLIGAGEAVLVLVLAVLIARRVLRGRRPRLAVDAAARHMAHRKDIEHLSARGALATAARLKMPEGTAPGVPLGLALPGRTPIYGDWESMHLHWWGTRTGKTTSQAIPSILAAPGCVLVTSNKRDIVDGTRLIRENIARVWVFDPHRLGGQDPTWWWNPLSYVRDVDRAMRLAALLAGFSKTAEAKTDAYFDPAGEELLGCLLLAAAGAGRPITDVYLWLSDVNDTTPVDLLRAHGHDLPAASVQGTVNFAEEQKDGVYGTARKAVAFLVNPAVTAWITPGPDRERPRFEPATFVRSRQSLYSLSMEGRAGAAIVAALNVAVIEAAEELSFHSPGGRLAVPFLGVLDEAANGVRWRDLPDRYSHYGSRGIILITILQSWAQGAEAWGEGGMRKLRDAANIRVYGGGSLDSSFTGDLSKLIGQFEPETHSISSQSGGGRTRSSSTQTRQEDILDIADLAALPRGRAVVFASGTRPILLETVPWQRSARADEVRASFARYDPKGENESDDAGEAEDAA